MQVVQAKMQVYHLIASQQTIILQFVYRDSKPRVKASCNNDFHDT